MKDYNRENFEFDEEWRRPRPEVSAEQAITHCIDNLLADTKHTMSEFVVKNVTFEELLGALLIALDEIKE